MKTNLMQLLRLVLMVLAVAGVIYAIEFMERGIAVWFWVALLVPGASRSASKRSAAAVRNADRGCNRRMSVVLPVPGA